MSDYTKDDQKEHRRLWVEALRSGKYKQARGVLNDGGGGFCCLGVACDISGLSEWHKSAFGTPCYFDHDKTLPRLVCDWLGLRGRMGGFREGDASERYKYLTDYNDAGMPFEEIADIIESEPPGLVDP